jgi:hypothetical protein
VKVLNEPQIVIKYIVLQTLYKPKESVLKDYFNDKEKDSKYKSKDEMKKSSGSGVQHLEADDLMSNDPKMVRVDVWH